MRLLERLDWGRRGRGWERAGKPRLVAAARALGDREIHDGELRKRPIVRAQETRGNRVAQLPQTGRFSELRDALLAEFADPPPDANSLATNIG